MLQNRQNHADKLPMPLTMLRVGFALFLSSVNRHIVHINREPTLGHLVRKDGVHHCLKGGRRVREAEEHDCWFKQSLVRDKCGFPLVTVFDSDIVVTPSDVKFGEQ